MAGRPERRRDRLTLAREAGYGRISGGSAVTGLVVALGAFALLGAATAAAVGVVGRQPLNLDDWRRAGVGGAVALVAILFISYLYGGYVAGRMARRSGALQGLFVFVLSLVVVGAVGAVLASQADTSQASDQLRRLGLPTSTAEWRTVGSLAGVGSLLAMFLGSVLGGSLGDRWHTKLARRAADPAIGPDATEASRDHRSVESGRTEVMDRSAETASSSGRAKS